jgi:hypothetical protein
MGLLDDMEGKGAGDDDAGETHAKLGTGPDKGAPGTPADKAKKQHKDNLIIIVVSIVGVIVTFLIYRANKANASAASGTTSALPQTSGNVAGSSTGSDQYADSMVEQLGQQETANASALAGLQTLIGNLGNEITQLQSGPGPTTNPGTQAPAVNAPVSGINWQDFAKTVTFQQLQGEPGAYTPIGYYGGPNGTDFVGANVTGGAPVYAGIFGGLAQGFNPTSLPEGTELYIPSQYKGNEVGTAAVGSGASGYTALGEK